MLSYLRDLMRMFRAQDVADIVTSAVKQFFRIIEGMALPILLLATLALVVVAASRALAWSTMTHLVTNPKDRIQAETQIFVTLGQILGGGFILTGLYFTSRSYILARRGQFAERLGSAIEGLGADNLQRRVGSIISLGAMIGAQRGDASVVTGVVCAFIRTATNTDEYRDEHSNSSPRADVQAALTVLSGARRRTIWWRWIEIDLRASVLSNADFSVGDFRRAMFQECLLAGTSFFRCRLSGADFAEATLDGSNFNQSDLRRASFFKSAASSSTFRRSNLVRANLTRADLRECGFGGSRIINSTFGQAKLEGASFRKSHVRGGDYHKVEATILAQMNRTL
jgi:uncharacterized protein YjbI with pentapeptide repeats